MGSSTYVKRQLCFGVSEQSSGKGQVVYRGDTEIKFEALAALNEVEAYKLAISIPTTNLDVMEGRSVAAGVILYIETDKEITVKLGTTGDTAITVKPVSTPEATTKPGVLYLEGSFTHVYISTVGASGTANIFCAIVGA